MNIPRFSGDCRWFAEEPAVDKNQIDALLSPTAYDEITTSVQLLQTHVSLLFLTDRYVYKIKKPVDFGFLNFTTLERRRFYCEEEVRLNRRLCPRMYLGVVEVRESPYGVSVGGSGRVIDYAVKMKRLPAECMLDRLLAAGRVDEADMRRITRRIGEFHLAAERVADCATSGSIAALQALWEENFRHLAHCTGLTLAEADLALLRSWVAAWLAEQADCVAARAAEGFIRDCNGDIHSENICLADDLYIFDCIEFDHRFRRIDTAADIAFLLMDLEFRGRRDLAAAVLDEYGATTGDRIPGPLLIFYLVYRAVVRGKVESLRLFDPLVDAGDKQLARAAAERHFRLARGYVARQAVPAGLIVFCGLMGSGKSTLARELAFDLGAELLASDVLRKELAGVSPRQRRSCGYNEGMYTAGFTRKTYGELFRRAEAALGRGKHVILDASFARLADRCAVRDIAGRFGVSCTLLQACCPEDEIHRRLDERSADATAVSDGRWEFYLPQKTEFEPLTAPGETWHDIDTSAPVGDSLRCILHLLGGMEP